MADWSQLPRELLDLISQHLDTEFDLLRFRSVCSSWRFSVRSPYQIHPHFPILPNEGINDTCWGFFLSIRTIFALSLPQFDKTAQSPHITGSVKHPMQAAEPEVRFPQFDRRGHGIQDSISTGSREEGLTCVASQFDKGKFSACESATGESPEEGSVYENLPEIDLPELDCSWIIKIEQDDHDLTHLFYPLSRSPFKSLPDDFPKTLDLMKFRVSELGHEYILQYIDYRPFANSLRDATNLYMEKVALGVDSRKGYVLLTIHVSGKLALFRFGEKRWNLINDFPSPYDDVISFRGQFYAVDNNGRTVIVNVDSPTPAVVLVANPVFGGDKKALVVSCGELLMVDTYLSVGPDDDMDFEEELDFYEDADCYISERTVRFKVFRLDQREQIWVEVKDLGDRILFLGDYSTFSASALDFSGCKGNHIIFADHNFYWSREEDGATKGRGIGVFDLESGSIGPLSKYPGYSKLFWPPPSWVSSTTLEDGLNQLGI